MPVKVTFLCVCYHHINLQSWCVHSSPFPGTQFLLSKQVSNHHHISESTLPAVANSWTLPGRFSSVADHSSFPIVSISRYPHCQHFQGGRPFQLPQFHSERLPGSKVTFTAPYGISPTEYGTTLIPYRSMVFLILFQCPLGFWCLFDVLSLGNTSLSYINLQPCISQMQNVISYIHLTVLVSHSIIKMYSGRPNCFQARVMEYYLSKQLVHPW